MNHRSSRNYFHFLIINLPNFSISIIRTITKDLDLKYFYYLEVFYFSNSVSSLFEINTKATDSSKGTVYSGKLINFGIFF